MKNTTISMRKLRVDVMKRVKLVYRIHENLLPPLVFCHTKNFRASANTLCAIVVVSSLFSVDGAETNKQVFISRAPAIIDQ